MMVVMLILSIVLAAMAPVMTTRNKTEQSSPWKYSEGNLSDAYYGLGDSQTAMIGQREFTDTDETAKLIINSSSSRPSQISFKHNGTNQGILRLLNNSIMLGSMTAGSSLGDESVSIGYFSDGSGDYSVSLGRSSRASGTDSTALGNISKSVGGGATSLGYNSEASKDYSTALGSSSKATGDDATAIGYMSAASGDSAVSIGYNSSAGTNNTAVGSKSEASGSKSSALGYEAKASGTWTSAYGYQSKASGNYSSAYGEQSLAEGGSSSAFGNGAHASGESSSAYGNEATASGSTSVAIGRGATTTDTDAIAIGNGVTASGESSIAIGSAAGTSTTGATGEKAIAIGDGSLATNSATVAIGNYAMARGANNIAIGNNACRYVTGNNKICIGTDAGPKSGDSWGSDGVERVFIGGRSAYNDGAAPLEIHNGTGWNYVMSGGRTVAPTTVVINGALIVKGGIITSMPWVDDRDFDGSGGVNMVGRTGGQLEPVNMDWNGNSNQVSGEYGSASRGYFKSPNDGNPFTFSDKRLKYVGKEFTSGLEKIRELKVFNYTFKKDKKKTPHVGVIAQDLQKIFPDAVTKGKDGFLRIRMEDMFYAVINSIKELDARVTALEKENKDLKQRLEKLEAKLK